MVLRGQPVGEQGAADRWAALRGASPGSAGGLRAPFFHADFRMFRNVGLSMYSIFLIGNIASGKSSAASYLEHRGARRIDLDAVCKNMYVAGAAIVDDLAEEFGLDILSADGGINTSKLAAHAFVDAESTNRLNSIVHPYVAEYVVQTLLPANCCSTLVPEFPLTVVELSVASEYRDLFPLADEVLAISAPEDVRRDRAISRGLNPVDVDRRMSVQPNEHDLLSLATTVIVNDGSEAALYEKLEAWLRERSINL